MILIDHARQIKFCIAEVWHLCHLDDIISWVSKLAHVAPQFLAEISTKLRVDGTLINFKAILKQQKTIERVEDFC